MKKMQGLLDSKGDIKCSKDEICTESLNNIADGYRTDLEDLISLALIDGESESWDALRDYLDGMKEDSEADLEELKKAIDDFDLEELYRTLYFTFERRLSDEEYEKYRRKYYSVFDSDFVDRLFPDRSKKE